MSDFIKRERINAFLEGLLNSKYKDLIIISAVVLAFALLIMISAASS